MLACTKFFWSRALYLSTRYNFHFTFWMSVRKTPRSRPRHVFSRNHTLYLDWCQIWKHCYVGECLHTYVNMYLWSNVFISFCLICQKKTSKQRKNNKLPPKCPVNSSASRLYIRESDFFLELMMSFKSIVLAYAWRWSVMGKRKYKILIQFQCFVYLSRFITFFLQ